MISIDFNTQFVNIWKKQNGDSWQSTYQWNILYISIFSYTSKSCFVAVLYGVSANFTTFCIDQSFLLLKTFQPQDPKKGPTVCTGTFILKVDWKFAWFIFNHTMHKREEIQAHTYEVLFFTIILYKILLP